MIKSKLYNVNVIGKISSIYLDDIQWDISNLQCPLNTSTLLLQVLSSSILDTSL